MGKGYGQAIPRGDTCIANKYIKRKIQIKAKK